MSTGIDSEADVTAFAASEARLLSANNCEKKLNILEEGGTVNTDLMKKKSFLIITLAYLP